MPIKIAIQNNDEKSNNDREEIIFTFKIK